MSETCDLCGKAKDLCRAPDETVEIGDVTDCDGETYAISARKFLRSQRDLIALRAALAEALDAWKAILDREYEGTDVYNDRANRIAELRAKFLETK